MPYDLRIEEELWEFRFHGTIEPEDLQKSFDEVEKIEAVHETIPDRLTDLSGSDTAHWNFFIIEELARRRRAAQLKNKVKSAIYAPTDLQFGYSRMFQMLNDNPKIEVAVFRDLADAEAWLGIDTKRTGKT